MPRLGAEDRAEPGRRVPLLPRHDGTQHPGFLLVGLALDGHDVDVVDLGLDGHDIDVDALLSKPFRRRTGEHGSGRSWKKVSSSQKDSRMFKSGQYLIVLDVSGGVVVDSAHCSRMEG